MGNPFGVRESMIAAEHLYRSPNALIPFYKRFRVRDRLLLTGHSHQAWPDCGFEGQQQSWLDAAERLDRKWDLAFAKADLVRKGFARLMDDCDGEIALGPSTHDLVVRFLSALPLRQRPRIVTTDGEFHSLRRQLDRVAEEGIAVVKVPSCPASSVAERLMAATDDRVAAVMVSSVFFQTGAIVAGLGDVLEKCRRVGAELLVDAYHSLNVAPFSLRLQRLEDAFVVGGGYKYCQLGEGNCFLRFPKDCGMRPLVTGWFSEFDALATGRTDTVSYGMGPARFAGSSYDPASHYRAAEVFAFFKAQGLDPAMLREVSQHQIRLLAGRFDALDLNPRVVTRDRSLPLAATGGFLVLQSACAGEFCRLLYDRGVHADFRGGALRLGPAPYLSDQQLLEAADILGDVCAGFKSESK
jgi:kynureninase